MELRQSAKSVDNKPRYSTDPNPFTVYEEKPKVKQNKPDVPYKGNSLDIIHILRSRATGLNEALFETNLRHSNLKFYTQKERHQLKSLERSFNLLPAKNEDQVIYELPADEQAI